MQRRRTEGLEMDWLQGRTADHTFTRQGQIPDPLESQIARSMHEYHQARQIKLPDAVPASAGGQVKTSTDSHPFASSPIGSWCWSGLLLY